MNSEPFAKTILPSRILRLLGMGLLGAVFFLQTLCAHAEAPAPSASPVPEGLALMPGFETLVLNGGCSDQIEVTKDGLDYDGMSWVSDDPETALVEGRGVVIALKKGACTVTGTDTDGSGNTVTCTVRVASNRKAPAVPASLKGMCYRRKEKFTPEERRTVEKIVSELAAHVQSGSADCGERLAYAALGYLGRDYGTLKDHVDCSMLLFWAAYDNGLYIPRRSDWQAEAMLRFEAPENGYRAGDYLFLGAQEGDTCRCSGECTRFRRIHHAAVVLCPYDGGWLVAEASSVIHRVVIRWWDGSPVHAGFDVALVARPALLMEAAR